MFRAEEKFRNLANPLSLIKSQWSCERFEKKLVFKENSRKFKYLLKMTIIG